MAGRGVLGGLALATVFGVLNGIAVFGPALRDGQKQKLAKANRQLEVTNNNQQDITEEEKQVPSFDDQAPKQLQGSATPPLTWLHKKWDWRTFWREGDVVMMEEATARKTLQNLVTNTCKIAEETHEATSRST